MEESRTPEAVAKSLRWLSNMFPIVIGSDDREDRMSTCIHMYTASGADTISRLEAENAQLRAELEQVKRERDAAVEDLRVCSIENNMECQYCLYRTARSFCWNCTDGSNWKFRGQKED